MHKNSFARFCCCAVALTLGASAGCGKAPKAQFHLNGLEIAKRDVPLEQQQLVANVLEAMFGTPDDPYVLPDAGLDLVKIKQAAGPVWSDQAGHQGGLYRQHCQHCHGTTGDGAGPTAAILNPYPRDYRQGKFKFKCTELSAKPTEVDLDRLLRQGVPGTAMPSFDLLPSDEVAALVEYVKYLSMRGQVEISLYNTLADLGVDDKLDTGRAVLVDEVLKPIAESWSGAPTNIITVVPPTHADAAELAKSVEHGRELFLGSKANCVKCHGPTGLGDGQANDYDDWNKALFEFQKQVKDRRKEVDAFDASAERKAIDADDSLSADVKKEKLAELDERNKQIPVERRALAEKQAAIDAFPLPLRTIMPRNLRLGVYRGGRRPVDLYYRVHAGIYGVPMPGLGPTAPGAKGQLSPEEIWSLIDYVRSMPYEPISRAPKQTAVEGRPQL